MLAEIGLVTLFLAFLAAIYAIITAIYGARTHADRWVVSARNASLLTFPLLKDAEIALVDINKQRLNFARRACEKIIAQGNYPAKLTWTTDRREVLEDADAVMVTILCGSTNVWQHDLLIPKKYGVDINVGDTRGPSGIFRALRTIPEMLGICRDMEELCPHALLLNYTNPMSMIWPIWLKMLMV
mgnify:CR=1 FL=1